MNKAVSDYLHSLQKELDTGRAAEASYRHAFKALLESAGEGIVAVNDGRRVECGAPDFIVSKGDVIVGYAETKDLGKNLDEVEKSEQMSRYREALENLILTDYIEFRFYRTGERVESLRIGELKDGKLLPRTDGERLANLLTDFVGWRGRTIGSASRLAQLMAAKARLMRDVILEILKDERGGLGEVHEQLRAFRHVLIKDMSEAQFADMYAQTIAYGLFAARLNDKTPEKFSRQEARDLVPRSNPFLLNLFNYVAGPQLDDRLSWIVDELAEIFSATDIPKVMKSFGQGVGERDPVIHFYETFLGAYDPKLREARGVWYTPEPIVQFLVRAADDVLKKEFGLPKGLADNSKITITAKAGAVDRRRKDKEAVYEKEIHRVRILDPATGTGTFLAEAVRCVYENFKGQEGVWGQYVNEHLVPRLFGFEILMAPYAMAHLKLDWVLRETGYRHEDERKPGRLGVYLTNSLEPAHEETGTLFENFLAKEAAAADHIKNETSVMVVMGNPPYSGLSANMGKWATDLIAPYKMEPGGEDKLKEKKHWLNDDYVKFIRLAEWFIERNGEGVLAYITNHGYIDNPTFRGMRWHLLKTFEKIYILDLHGNTKKGGHPPAGMKDENVFDIQQGVSIIVAFRKNGKRGLGKVYHAELWGSRDKKYEFLKKETIAEIDWKEVRYREPDYFFCPTNYRGKQDYEAGFSLKKAFLISSSGMISGRDGVTYSLTKERGLVVANDFKSMSEEELRAKYGLGKDARDWKVSTAKADMVANFLPETLTPALYRPFDLRYTIYTGNSRGVFASPQKKVMAQMVGENIALLATKVNRQRSLGYTFVTRWITDFHVLDTAGDSTSVFPLWRQDEAERITNFNSDFLSEFTSKINHAAKPEEIFDYIYAALHSPSYRKKFANFLKSDFPRIPYPKDAKYFISLVEKGNELRRLHLVESPKLDVFITTFPKDGNNVVGKVRFENQKVYINETQYFDNTPKMAWEFFIGGYQPAQKWLKDRKGKKLTYEDINHWQKMIVALSETDRIMKEIDRL